MQANYTLSKDPLSLDRIRSILSRLEDTIIFSLIERAQFAHNPRIYDRGIFKELEDLEFKGSWLEWFLKETEAFHGTQYICLPLPLNHSLASQRKHGGTQGY
jgi:chorismate mutase